MKVILGINTCTVEREDGPRVYKESTLMTWIKRELQAQGHDVIMKDLSKEPGNLLSTGCYGIIARDRHFQIYFANYCIRPSYEDYNKRRVLHLNVQR
jgi:hypothetical protein